MKFVIAGGTGTVGSKLTRNLLAQGRQVRVLTRDTARAAERLGHHDGLELFGINLTQPGQLVEAFDEGDRVYLGLGGSPTQVRDENALVDAAAAAGAGQLVKLSCEGVDSSTQSVILDVHRAVESHLAESGVPSTLLRPSTFIDAVVRIASQFIPQNAWGGDSAGGVCTFVDTRDVAEVAAGVLTQGPDVHAERIDTPTGPRAMSMAEVAEAISGAVGQEVVHHQRSESVNEAFLTGLDLPALQVAVLLSLDRFVREGTMSEVHEDTYDLLGTPARPATTFIDQTAPGLLQSAA